jgi:hypothetical protein
MKNEWGAGVLAAVAIAAVLGACSRPPGAAPASAENRSESESVGGGPPPHAGRVDTEGPEGAQAAESVNTAPDPVTVCPSSDRRPTVFIRDCDTGVANVAVGPCTLADQIHPCEAGTVSDFPRCIAKVTERLVDSGVIHGKDKGSLQICAANDREEEGEPPQRQ